MELTRRIQLQRSVLGACVAAFCLALGLRGELNMWVGTGLAAGASTLLLWLMYSRTEGARPTFDRPSAQSVAIGTAVGVVMAVGTWVLYPISIRLVPEIAPEVGSLYALLRQPPGPLAALPLLLFVVAAEELVFRGLAIDVLSKPLGQGRAVVVAALLYTLPQIAMRSPVLIFVALSCGLVWGFLRLRTGGLAAPFLAHIVWNILVFVLYPVA